ncbi:MAG: DUF3179 domain-containing protein [Candidatus Rokubacteria bacterium]|nr:DUF3179 domain-containing protein [Candidatus Rokubacteria bacterium]
MRHRVRDLLLLLGCVAFFSDMVWAVELKTNRSKALVSLDEILPGGPPPDGIPAIDRPKFVAPKEADGWLTAKEPVLAVELNGEARAYPLQILTWHEIVNDTIGGRAVSVTYCPLCNSGIVFDRRIGEKTYDFGTSGMLYKSDLVMYDRQTHSLWAQMEGRAIVGDLAGVRLTMLPANTLAYGDWKRLYPGGQVLSRDTGHGRMYGRNPYDGYDQPNSHPFLYFDKVDPRLPPKERVAGVLIGDKARAYPFGLLANRKVVADAVGGHPVVVFYRPGTLSALDHALIAQSREVGATAVFSPVVDGKVLTFEATAGGFRDTETKSLWSLLGRCYEGALSGKALRPIVHIDAFWFAWAAFQPRTDIYGWTPSSR